MLPGEIRFKVFPKHFSDLIRMEVERTLEWKLKNFRTSSDLSFVVVLYEIVRGRFVF